MAADPRPAAQPRHRRTSRSSGGSRPRSPATAISRTASPSRPTGRSSCPRATGRRWRRRRTSAATSARSLHLTAEGAAGAGQSVGRARRRRGRVLVDRPPQRARPRVRARRPAVGERDGPAGRRRDQSDPAGQELRLAARVLRQPLWRRRHSRRPQAADGFEEPKVWWNPSISPGALLIYSGDLFPQWKGDALIGALSGEALIRVDIDGDKARKADQWADGRAHPRGRPGPARRGLSARGRTRAGGCSG